MAIRGSRKVPAGLARTAARWAKWRRTRELVLPLPKSWPSANSWLKSALFRSSKVADPPNSPCVRAGAPVRFILRGAMPPTRALAASKDQAQPAPIGIDRCDQAFANRPSARRSCTVRRAMAHLPGASNDVPYAASPIREIRGSC